MRRGRRGVRMAWGLRVIVLVALVTAGAFSFRAEEGVVAPAFFAPASLDLGVGELPAGTVSNGAEPVILVTRDGSTILVADYTGMYRSTNGGVSWQRAPDPFLDGIFSDGWPLAEDDTGRIYAAYTNGQIVGVASSANKGVSWDVVSRVVTASHIADRPWLAARGDGEVALVVWGTRGEECYRSLDRGATFLDVSLNGNPPPNAGSLSYDPQGRLWYANSDNWYVRSGGCSGTWVPRAFPAAGAQILTQAAVDSSSRPYTAAPSTSNGQMLIHSRDATGLKTLAVSPAGLRSNTFGAIAVDNVTGDVAVSWYASTTAGNPSSQSFSGEWHVFVARVSGYWTATPTVTVTQVTSQPNHVGGFCMGGIGCSTGTADRDLLDYHGVAFAPDHSIHVAYGHDGATSNAVVRHAHVA